VRHRRLRRIAAVLTVALAAVGGGVVAVTALGPARPAGAVEDYLAPAGGVFTLSGHGFGHGIGLSQYGARGAATAGLTGRQILDFYYPGTATTTLAAGSPIRVRLTGASPAAVPVQSAAGLQVLDAATGQVTALARSGAAVRYRIVADAAALRVQTSADSGATWTAVALTGGATGAAGPLVFRGPAELRLYLPDGSARDYAGTVTGIRSGATTLTTVNTLGLDPYVAGVLGREMPASWPAAALQAQTVAARTYAAFERASAPATAAWDICDSTSCQVYGGRRLISGGVVTDLQPAPVLAAVAATAGQIRTFSGTPIFAQFSASNGGWTVADTRFPYLVAKADPYDVPGNPYGTWSATLSVTRLAECFPEAGTVNRLSILSRDGNGQWGGRIGTVRLYGRTAAGAAVQFDVTGDRLRSCGTASGVRSTYATIVSAWRPTDSPAGVRHPDGSLDVVARGATGDVQHRRYTPAGGWQPWASLGGGVLGAPTIERTATGTVLVWIRGTNGALYGGTLSGGRFSGWRGYGGGLTTRPSPVTLPDGSRYVLARGNDAQLWAATWSAAGTWAGWRALGGGLLAGAGPAGAATGPGALTVAVVGTDHRVFTRSLQGGAWTGWRTAGGSTSADLALTAPAAGVLDAYSLDAGSLWTARSTAGRWSAWSNAGGAVATGPFADAVEGTGRTEVWVVGSDGWMYLRARTAAWGGWQRLP
jgi:stage II sporulation protein D